MAFIVEDETGLSNATSLVSLEDALDYFEDRLNDNWINLSTATKEASLIKATSYIDMVYGDSFIGEPLKTTQSLSFPRILDSITLYPTQLKYACCELAIRASTTELMPDSTQKVKSEAVGSIKVEYSEFANQQTQYSIVYNLLKTFLNGVSNSVKVIRV